MVATYYKQMLEYCATRDQENQPNYQEIFNGQPFIQDGFLNIHGRAGIITFQLHATSKDIIVSFRGWFKNSRTKFFWFHLYSLSTFNVETVIADFEKDYAEVYDIQDVLEKKMHQKNNNKRSWIGSISIQMYERNEKIEIIIENKNTKVPSRMLKTAMKSFAEWKELADQPEQPDWKKIFV